MRNLNAFHLFYSQVIKFITELPVKIKIKHTMFALGILFLFSFSSCAVSEKLSSSDTNPGEVEVIKETTSEDQTIPPVRRVYGNKVYKLLY